MSFPIIEFLTRPSSHGRSLHNVRLLDAQPALDGYERLTIEHEGITHELPGALKWNDRFGRDNVDRVGQLVPDGAGRVRFFAYIDQTLRRAPHVDVVDEVRSSEGHVKRVLHGWHCAAKPQGFLAPAGIVPGQEGAFVPDETVPVTVRVPPEFAEQAARVQMTPQALLESFIGDLAAIRNQVVSPRVDGFGSNGSDERRFAEEWLERAHGTRAIGLDELERRREEAREKAFFHEELASLLDDYSENGGKPDELIAAVAELVDQKSKEQPE